jgi:hypothetical protein
MSALVAHLRAQVIPASQQPWMLLALFDILDGAASNGDPSGVALIDAQLLNYLRSGLGCLSS